MGIDGERKLIRKALQGDRQAFGLLVECHQGAIYGMLVRMTGSRELAADLAQDAFVRAWEKLDSFRPGARFLPWMYAIARNLALDHFRSSHHHEIPVEPGKVETLADPGFDRDLESQVDAGAVIDKLLALPADYREALLLRYREGCSMKEVAQALGIGLSAAKMRVSRGLAMLRESFL